MVQVTPENKSMATPLVSIVLPVYNVEEYLSQSLDSVVNQTYNNLEIICVDDGSTDNSGATLQKYKDNDSRIQIITQNNQGVSAARNAGMDLATGKYIIFWDPDDYFHLKAIEYMVERAEKERADVCICDAQHFYSDTGQLTHHPYIVAPKIDASVFSWRDCPDQIFFVGSSVPWNKLVLLSLLRDHDIRFPDVPYLVDNEYMFLVMCYAERITLCKRRLIYYRMDRPNSLVQNNDKSSKNVVTIFRKIYDELNKRKLLEDPALRYCFFKKTASMYHYRIRYCNSFSDYEKLYNQFVVPASPLSEYDSDYEELKRIDDMGSLSGGDYLLNAFKNLQRANDNKQQKLLTANRKVRTLESKNEKLIQNNNNLSAENKHLKHETEKLKKEIDKVRSSNSFKIGKAITYLPRQLKNTK